MNLSQNSQPATGDVPPEEKALLTTGADYWSTHAIPELGGRGSECRTVRMGCETERRHPITSAWAAACRLPASRPVVTLPSIPSYRTVGEALAGRPGNRGCGVGAGDQDQTLPAVRPELRVLSARTRSFAAAAGTTGARHRNPRAWDRHSSISPRTTRRPTDSGCRATWIPGRCARSTSGLPACRRGSPAVDRDGAYNRLNGIHT